MKKVRRARSVKAPQSARRGTAISPRLSRSTRVAARARRRRLTPVDSGSPLARRLALADQETVTIALGRGLQGRTLAVAAEVPRLEAFAMIRPGRGHNLRRVAGDQHVATPARRGTLHRDVAQLVLVHASRPPPFSSIRARARLCVVRGASAMPRA